MSINFESKKTLAGTGAVLLAVGSIIPIVGIIGIILLLLGLKGLAEYYQESKIYINAFYGFFFGIVGIGLVAMLTFTTSFFPIVYSIVTNPSTIPAEIAKIIFDITLIIIVIFIFHLLGALFLKRAFGLLKQKTGKKIFGVSGLLLLICAIMTIIIVGLLIMLIAWLVTAIAFFQMKPSPPIVRSKSTI